MTQPSLAIEPIDDVGMNQALKLLVRGFPGSEAFWRRGLERAQLHQDPAWPLGFLLRHGGQPAGIVLTLASRRMENDGTENVVVNLSSWYVDPAARAAAPWMLMKILGRRADIYTDLTASPQVATILSRLGFMRWNDAILIASWPQTFFAPRTAATVVRLADIPDAALDRWHRALLDDHDKLGCVTGVLIDGGQCHPLAFQRIRWNKLPFARLVYVTDRQRILAYRRAISRFLLGHGLPLWCMDADRAHREAGCLLLERRQDKYFRGPLRREGIDYAYSELVYFGFFYP